MVYPVTKVYGNAMTFMLNGYGQNWAAVPGTSPIGVALFTNTYVPNQDADVTFGSLNGAAESVATGYARYRLTGTYLATDAPGNMLTLDTATNPHWNVSSNLTFRYVVYYYDDTASTSINSCALIAYTDYLANITVTASSGTHADVTFPLPVNGIFQFHTD